MKVLWLVFGKGRVQHLALTGIVVTWTTDPAEGLCLVHSLEMTALGIVVLPGELEWSNMLGRKTLDVLQVLAAAVGAAT
jgi:hypothetical protein